MILALPLLLVRLIAPLSEKINMSNMQRLKSTLLTELDGRWYYQRQPYTGILFFDKENYLIEVFEVTDGVITKPYTPICQYKPI